MKQATQQNHNFSRLDILFNKLDERLSKAEFTSNLNLNNLKQLNESLANFTNNIISISKNVRPEKVSQNETFQAQFGNMVPQRCETQIDVSDEGPVLSEEKSFEAKYSTKSSNKYFKNVKGNKEKVPPIADQDSSILRFSVSCSNQSIRELTDNLPSDTDEIEDIMKKTAIDKRPPPHASETNFKKNTSNNMPAQTNRIKNPFVCPPNPESVETSRFVKNEQQLQEPIENEASTIQNMRKIFESIFKSKTSSQNSFEKPDEEKHNNQLQQRSVIEPEKSLDQIPNLTIPLQEMRRSSNGNISEQIKQVTLKRSELEAVENPKINDNKPTASISPEGEIKIRLNKGNQERLKENNGYTVPVNSRQPSRKSSMTYCENPVISDVQEHITKKDPKHSRKSSMVNVSSSLPEPQIVNILRDKTRDDSNQEERSNIQQYHQRRVSKQNDRILLGEKVPESLEQSLNYGGKNSFFDLSYNHSLERSSEFCSGKKLGAPSRSSDFYFPLSPLKQDTYDERIKIKKRRSKSPHISSQKNGNWAYNEKVGTKELEWQENSVSHFKI